jgi:splicing factor 3B subunit 1
MIGGATPGYAGATPTPNNLKTPDILNMPGSKLQQLRWEKELEERNRPYTDEELDMLLPGNDDGYEILKPPENYQPQSKNGLAPTST